MRSGRLGLLYRSGALWFLAAIIGGQWLWLLLCFGLTFASFQFRFDRPSSEITMAVALVPTLIVVVPVFWLCRRRRQILFKELWPHRLAVCPTCWYPMLRDSERCSECGREISRRQAQEFWVGIFSQPMNAILREAWVVKAGMRRRENRAWTRRNFNWAYKVFRGKPLFPLRK